MSLQQIGYENSSFFSPEHLKIPGTFIYFNTAYARGSKTMIVECDVRQHIKDEYWLTVQPGDQILTEAQNQIFTKLHHLMLDARKKMLDIWKTSAPPIIVFVELGIRATPDKERYVFACSSKDLIGSIKILENS